MPPDAILPWRQPEAADVPHCKLHQLGPTRHGSHVDDDIFVGSRWFRENVEPKLDETFKYGKQQGDDGGRATSSRGDDQN